MLLHRLVPPIQLVHRHLQLSLPLPLSQTQTRFAHWQRYVTRRRLNLSLQRPLPLPYSRFDEPSSAHSKKSSLRRRIYEKHVVPRLAHSKSPIRSLLRVRPRALAKALASTPNYPLTPNLRHFFRIREIDPDTFRIWVEVLSQRSLIYALTRLGLLESAGEHRDRVPCPAWLLLALPGLAKEQSDGPYLVGLLMSPVPWEIRGDPAMMLARSLQALIKIKHFVAARELVDWIGSTPPPRSISSALSQVNTFAGLLAALSPPTTSSSSASSHSAPPPALLHSLRDDLRTTFLRQGIEPTVPLYWPLFSPSLIPQSPAEAREVLQDMRNDGLETPRELVDAVYRVYAAAGDFEGGKRFLRDFRSREKEDLGLGLVREDSDKLDQISPSSSSISSVSSPSSSTPPPALLPARMAQTPSESSSTSSTTFSVPLPVDFDLPRPLRASPASAALNILGKTPSHALEYFSSLPSPMTETWTALLHLLGRSSDSSSAQILTVLSKFQQQRKLKPSLKNWTTAFNGLMRKGDSASIRLLWEQRLKNKFEKERVRIDWRFVTVIVKAYLAGGELEKAEEMLFGYLKDLAPTGSRLSRILRRREYFRRMFRPPPPFIDVTPLNLLISAHNRAGNYSTSYNLFKQLSTIRSDPSNPSTILPDVATFSILFDTARHASAYAGSGYGPGFESLPERRVRDLERDPVVVDDKWEGGSLAAWRIAAEMGWKVLEENWPAAVREEKVGNILLDKKGISGLRKWLWSSVDEKEEEEKPSGVPLSKHELDAFRKLKDYKPFEATLFSSNSPPTYPHIYPTPQFFRSFIQLVGYHGAYDSVPLLLSWMKYLDVQPERKTLTLALVYVGESGVGVKELERVKTWLKEWIGENRVPREDEIAKFRSGR